MAQFKIIEETPIPIADLKEELKEIKKRDEELSFRAAKIADQLEGIKVLKPKEAQEAFAKIDKLKVPRLKETHIHKIIDLMPANMTEIKNIVQGYSLTATNDNLEKILEIISEYSAKK